MALHSRSTVATHVWSTSTNRGDLALEELGPSTLAPSKPGRLLPMGPRAAVVVDRVLATCSARREKERDLEREGA